MDLNLSPAESRFKERITLFIDSNFPPAVRESPSPADINRWYVAVAEQGWTAPEWTVKAGGTGWEPMGIYLWYSLTTDAHCPIPDYCALQIAGPLILRYADNPLHQIEINNILNHSVNWGSAFFPADTVIAVSETTSGYELNGSLPCYTTSGVPDRILVLGDTGNAHALFIVDACLPGTQLSSESLHGPISTLKMKQVQVSGSALLGHYNMGLDHLVHLLTEEQSISTVVSIKSSLYSLRNFIQDSPLEEEFESQLADYEIELHGLEVTALRSMIGDNRHGLQAVNSRVEKLRLNINGSINNALGYYSIPRQSQLPGENEPSPGTGSQLQQSKQVDPFSNCPEGFREDLIAKTMLGL